MDMMMMMMMMREYSDLRRFGDIDLRSLGRIAAECIQPTRPIPHTARLLEAFLSIPRNICVNEESCKVEILT